VAGMPGRHVARYSASLFPGATALGHAARQRRSGANRRSGLGRSVAVVAAAIAVCAMVLPDGVASAAPTAHASGTPSLDATLAQANKLSQQIDALSQQYDNLQIQLNQARAAVKLAHQNAARDLSIFAQGQGAIGSIAVENYMTGGLNPTLQLLTTNSPQSLLNRASIMTQLQRENGAKVSLVASAEVAAQRAEAAAGQQQRRAASLAKQMQAKVAAIQQRENFFNSQAFDQAEQIYAQTGQYPDISVSGDSVGVQALKWALTRIGDPYVWGAAGPSSFDCSGLVMWAYAQVGISLEHFTGDQWNEGEHVSRDQLKPGDLVFFYADLGHVGLYIGNGLMVDAPTFGQTVQVQPVMWDVYEGAVQIA
jgi:peptidoglycan DL-endopeptidase CwlO